MIYKIIYGDTIVNKMAFIFLVIVFLGGCATQDKTIPTYEEVRLREAIDNCKKDANALIDPPRNSSNIYWDNYFTMCMKTRYGYTSKDLRGVWY